MSTSIDGYFSVEEPSVGHVKDRGSKFIAYLIPCKNEYSFKDQLDLVKLNEPNARHYCWAYRVNPESIFERSNDDGEPGNSAGTPILRALQSHELVDVACIVARYFGGTKLGIPGLIRAYGGSAKGACELATIMHSQITRDFKVDFSYDQISFVERLVRELNLEIIQREQESELKYVIRVNRSKLEQTLDQFEKNHLLRVTVVQH